MAAAAITRSDVIQGSRAMLLSVPRGGNHDECVAGTSHFGGLRLFLCAQVALVFHVESRSPEQTSLPYALLKSKLIVSFRNFSSASASIRAKCSFQLTATQSVYFVPKTRISRTRRSVLIWIVS